MTVTSTRSKRKLFNPDKHMFLVEETKTTALRIIPVNIGPIPKKKKGDKKGLEKSEEKQNTSKEPKVLENPSLSKKNLFVYPSINTNMDATHREMRMLNRNTRAKKARDEFMKKYRNESSNSFSSINEVSQSTPRTDSVDQIRHKTEPCMSVNFICEKCQKTFDKEQDLE